jgi:hypothetical protein
LLSLGLFLIDFPCLAPTLVTSPRLELQQKLAMQFHNQDFMNVQIIIYLQYEIFITNLACNELIMKIV